MVGSLEVRDVYPWDKDGLYPDHRSFDWAQDDVGRADHRKLYVIDGTVAWIGGETFVSPTAELDVYDRVGGGDGFASGFFYGLMTGESPEQAVRLGWAHGALLTTFPGDTTMASIDQVRAFATGGSARIQR